MESSTPFPHPLQICLSASKKSGNLVSAANSSYEDRKYAEEIYHSIVFQYTSGLAHLPYKLRYMSPHPIMVSDHFVGDLKKFHHALVLALNHIVQHWFSDNEAAFSTRMPLELHEEQLLQVRNRHLREYHYLSSLPDNCLTVGVIAKRKESDAFIRRIPGQLEARSTTPCR